MFILQQDADNQLHVEDAATNRCSMIKDENNLNCDGTHKAIAGSLEKDTERQMKKK